MSLPLRKKGLYSVWMRENTDQRNYEYEPFSRSVQVCIPQCQNTRKLKVEIENVPFLLVMTFAQNINNNSPFMHLF